MSGIDWINRLRRWRMVFASWQLGTRSDSDAECSAVKDHRDLTLLLRAEMNALTGLLIEKQVFSAQEFTDRLQAECQHLCREYERRFPGFKASDAGIDMDLAIARDTMAGWPR